MSQSLLYHAFGVREGYEYRSTKYVEGRVEFHLAVKGESIQCPHCQGHEYWRRGKRQRRINTLPIGPKEVVLVVEVEVVTSQHQEQHKLSVLPHRQPRTMDL